MDKCTSCGHDVTSNYCGNCGQPRKPSPLEELKKHIHSTAKAKKSSAKRNREKCDARPNHAQYYRARAEREEKAAKKWESWLAAIQQLQQEIHETPREPNEENV